MPDKACLHKCRMLYVTLVHRFAGATSCGGVASTTDSQSKGARELLAPCSGTTDPWTPKAMISVNGKYRFLTAGVSYLAWLIVSPLPGGVTEPLTPSLQER